MKLRISNFRRWLESKPRDEVVGRTDDPCGCPVREYLVSKASGRWMVGSESYCLRPGSAHLQMPWDFTLFVTEVDRRGPHIPITAAECLAILDEIGGSV